MSKVLKALKLLASRRQSVVAATSFQEAAPSSADVSDANAGERPDFLETKYGLRLEVADAEQGTLKIRDTSAQIQAAQSARRRYRLFPDWQTSFLWKDRSRESEKNEAGDEDDDDDDPEVDEEVIEYRYPSLWPYYDTWRQTYETEFEKQGCHLGTGAEVFSDATDRISWDLEGLLMAAWLAMREDVESVEYCPRNEKYRIEKATIDTDFAGFLQGIWEEGAFIEFK